MDSIDRNILVALQHEGAAGLAELAKIAGCRSPRRLERVKRLEARHHPRLARDRPHRGWLPLLAWVFVALRTDAQDQVAATGSAAGTVLECHAVSVLVLHAEAARRHLRELEALVSQEIRRCAGVERTETVLALLTAKETAILPVAPPDDDEE